MGLFRRVKLKLTRKRRAWDIVFDKEAKSEKNYQYRKRRTA